MYDDVDIPLPDNFCDRFLGKPWYQIESGGQRCVRITSTRPNGRKQSELIMAPFTMMDHFIGQILDEGIRLQWWEKNTSYLYRRSWRNGLGPIAGLTKRRIL